MERLQRQLVIRDTLRRFEESDYKHQLSRMTTWAQPVSTLEPAPEPSGTGTLESMRKALLEEIRKGKRIQI